MPLSRTVRRTRIIHTLDRMMPQSSSTASVTPRAYVLGEGDRELRREERLCVARPTFHAAQPHESEEHLVVPPVVGLLRREVRVQQLDLACGVVGGEWYVETGLPEVAIPLRDLVVD